MAPVEDMDALYAVNHALYAESVTLNNRLVNGQVDIEAHVARITAADPNYCNYGTGSCVKQFMDVQISAWDTKGRPGTLEGNVEWLKIQMGVMAVPLATVESPIEVRLGRMSLLCQRAGLPQHVDAAFARIANTNAAIKVIKSMPQNMDSTHEDKQKRGQ